MEKTRDKGGASLNQAQEQPREKTWYTEVGYMDAGSKECDRFTKREKLGDDAALLRFANECDKGQGIDLSATFSNPLGEFNNEEGYHVVCEDDKHVVTRDPSREYAVMRKVPESAVRAAIEWGPRGGNAATTNWDVYDLIQTMAEEKLKPILGTLFIDGKEISIGLDKDKGKLYAGEVTERGVAREVESPVDLSDFGNLKENQQWFMEKVRDKWGDSRSKEQDHAQGQAQEQEQPREYYFSMEYLQYSGDTLDLDAMADKEDYDGLLFSASEYDDGRGIDLTETYHTPCHNCGDSVLCENSRYAVVYNNSVGGTYEMFRKVSEQEIRESINRWGMDSDATPDVKKVANAMAAEQFSRLPAYSFEVNGHEVYVDYDKEQNILYAGGATNAGVFREIEMDYDHNYSLDTNLENLYEKVMESPQYAEEQDLEEEQEETRGMGR